MNLGVSEACFRSPWLFFGCLSNVFPETLGTCSASPRDVFPWTPAMSFRECPQRVREVSTTRSRGIYDVFPGDDHRGLPTGTVPGKVIRKSHDRSVPRNSFPGGIGSGFSGISRENQPGRIRRSLFFDRRLRTTYNRCRLPGSWDNGMYTIDPHNFSTDIPKMYFASPSNKTVTVKFYAFYRR